jgi:N-acyl amino acid synthase of PEP-CTERM/exosortase system
MQTNAMTAAIAAVLEEFSVETADRKDLVREACELRHQVYCRERAFETPKEGEIETDDFDARARHVVLRHRASGKVIGTIRLVLMNPRVPDDSYPMQRACDSRFLRSAPRPTTAEASRFALSKELRIASPAAQGMLRLALVRGLVELSGQLGITHWCALMEPSLLRLLRATAMHFDAHGPLVEHHGMRQPSFTSLDAFLTRVERDQPAIWDFITDGGKFWSNPALAPAKLATANDAGSGALALSA